MHAGVLRVILDTVALCQRYDIQLMLDVLPQALFFAITAPDIPSPANADSSSNSARELRPDGAAARRAILAEIGAVVRAVNCSAAGRPYAALHLQAILSALDQLHRWRYDNGAVVSKIETRRAALAAAKPNAPPELPTAEQIEMKRRVDAVSAFQDALLQGEAPALPQAGAAASEVVDLSDEAAVDTAPVDAAAPAHAHACVTMEQLALASHACGAHARALRHYETWLRHRKKLLNNKARNTTGVTFTDDEVCLPFCDSLSHSAASLKCVSCLQDR
jgi:hypothetical protein